MPPFEDAHLPDFVPEGAIDSDEPDRTLALSGVAQDLEAIQRAVEDRMGERVAESHAVGIQPSIVNVEDRNCVGVAIAFGGRGQPRPRNATRLASKGGPRLVLFLVKPERPSQAAKRILGAARVAQSELAALPLQVVVTGVVHAHSFDQRMRPAPGGVSFAHHDSTAGTLGCLCTGRAAPRHQQLFILSNSHILANCNRGVEGDCCSQQSPADGGSCPGDGIATLERFSPIDFSGAPNLVDAATAETQRQHVRPEMVTFNEGQFRFFRISGTPRRAAENMLVGKTGRTTQVRVGRVTSVAAATIAVYPECGRSARFTKQIAIEGASGSFSEAGDSGSLVWTFDADKQPVGLIFSGGGSFSFANHIDDVLDFLDVDIVAHT